MGRCGLIVIQNLPCVEDGMNRISAAFIDHGENRAYACHRSAVVLNRFDTALDGIAGCDGGCENQHMLAGDHRLDVIAEDELASGGVLRCDDIDRVMDIDASESALGQIAGHAGTDNFGSVKTQDGVDDCRRAVFGSELSGSFLGFGKTVLRESQVNIVVDVAVAGREMSLCHTKLQRVVGIGIIHHLNCHNYLLLLNFRAALCLLISYQISQAIENGFEFFSENCFIGAILNEVKFMIGKKHIGTGILLILSVSAFLIAGEYIDVRNERIAKENAMKQALAEDMTLIARRNEASRREIIKTDDAYEAEQERLRQQKNDPEYREDAVQTETLPITAIGDSVMLGAADVMRSTFVNSSVDAEVSRSMYALLDIVIDDVSAGTLGNPVVIGIGTNGPLNVGVCEEVIDLCGSRDIFWLTTTNNWQFANTDTILSLGETHDNVTIIDWETISDGHGEYFYNDGIHLTPEGRAAYTEAIKDSLTAYYWDHRPEEPDHRIFLAGDDSLLSCFSRLPSLQETYVYAQSGLQADDLYEEAEKLKEAGNLGTTQILVIREDSENAKELIDECASMDGFLHVILVQKPGSEPVKSLPGADSAVSFILNEEDLLMDQVHMNAEAAQRLADFISPLLKQE